MQVVATAVFASVAAATLATPAGKARWIFTLEMKADTANGVPLAEPHTERRRFVQCLSQSTSDDLSDTIAPSFGSDCKAYQVHASDGAISFTAICPPDEDGMSLDLDADGHYDDRTLRLTVHGRATEDGDQAAMSGTVVGVRSGTCS